ncbi:MAG: hypothetical protein JXM72_01360, partial [Deltaproteobacteria bacterium]|nr:hypothetical protein [Deltaproteobacteria bacterium]
MKNQRISLMVFAAWTALLGSNLYAAVITYSGTVNYVDYDEETVTSAALPSGSVSVYDEDGDILLISASDITDGTFSFTINNADAGYQTGTSLGFLITGESIDGIGELVPVNCPYITVGIFDIDSLYFEIYSQRLVEYITTAYVDEGSEEHTAILIARLKNATETPFISSLYGGGSLAYTNIVDAIQDADPTLFIGLIDETVAHNAGLGLEFPVSATVAAALPGYALSTETVRFYPLSPVLQATSVASLKWGAEITGTAVYVDGNDDDVPLASGYIKLLDWDDTFWDGCEIMGADSGEFSLISP